MANRLNRSERAKQLHKLYSLQNEVHGLAHYIDTHKMSDEKRSHLFGKKVNLQKEIDTLNNLLLEDQSK